jgi:hypothetical protein
VIAASRFSIKRMKKIIYYLKIKSKISQNCDIEINVLHNFATEYSVTKIYLHLKQEEFEDEK